MKRVGYQQNPALALSEIKVAGTNGRALCHFGGANSDPDRAPSTLRASYHIGPMAFSKRRVRVLHTTPQFSR
jgi:hypothetical protein